MATYKVTITVSADEFMELLPHIGERKIDVKKIDLFQQSLPKAPAARVLRGSKVNDTVRAALANGPRTVKQLKAALEDAGLAAGSLSTALAALQRTSEVSRTADGIYQLDYQLEGQKEATQ